MRSEATSLLLALALLATEAGAQVSVTALDGEARLAGAPLALHAAVTEGRPLEVEGGGRCTLLLARRTLVRVCGRAIASVVAAGGHRPAEIELREGGLEVVAMPDSQKEALRIHTPAASLVLLGAGVRVEVEAGGDATFVHAFESPVRVLGAGGQDDVRVVAGQELRVGRDGVRGAAVPLSRAARERRSACAHRRGDFRATLRADRARLATGLPMVSAQAVDATPVAPVDHLLDIMRMDVPADGLPLQPPTPPSALVTELNKRGVDEEVCDPINCNPVYQVEPPGACGVPPQRGCIP